MTTGRGSCGIPPAGWWCSREHNHEGPCAAYPAPDVSIRSTHIPSETYTDLKPVFHLYKEQTEIAQKWMVEHDKAKHIPIGKKHRYSGTIGGAYTWMFTYTSIGIVITVQCSCGEKIDVSDYDQW